MAKKIDLEVKKIVDAAYAKALVTIRKNRKMLDKIVAELLKKETLDRDGFERIVGKKSSK
jgi:ATP-dependent Zn protease